MKNIIKATASRYLINVLMIAAFGISAATGLIKPGGGHERPHDFRSEQISGVKEITTAGFSGSLGSAPFERYGRPRQNEQENIHIYFGLIWLAMMMFHTLHHWGWFKKMLSVNHIRKNKLLSITVFVFALMAISGLLMWTKIVPQGFINIREIHEITGQLLLGLLLIHVIQRIKWYFTMTARFFKRKIILA